MTTAGTYLNTWWTKYMNQTNAINGTTLVSVIFDEDDSSTTTNLVFSALIPVNNATSKSHIKAGTTSSTAYNHYSLLKTVESNWNLGNLGRNDVSASAIAGI